MRSIVMFFDLMIFGFDPVGRKLLTKEMWEKKLENVNIPKEDMNKIVMNFLVTEGYVDTAEKFKIESGTKPDIYYARNAERMEIKKGVECGEFEGVVKKIFNLIPNVMDSFPELIVNLQNMITMELVHSRKFTEAGNFAMKELAPLAEALPMHVF
ncbi:protein GID8 homolog [Impatiens glandulifera]|uniref:protein GID8 homolog n=1 Tax=Impatiens glandulifera TaxID=253017 RepID=UPI001FB07763|nr:protein GID8 homolog [Impatiens glandulifera]